MNEGRFVMNLTLRLELSNKLRDYCNSCLEGVEVNDLVIFRDHLMAGVEVCCDDLKQYKAQNRKDEVMKDFVKQMSDMFGIEFVMTACRSLDISPYYDDEVFGHVLSYKVICTFDEDEGLSLFGFGKCL